MKIKVPNPDKFYRAFDFQDPKTKNVVLLKLMKNTKNPEEKVTIFKQFEQATVVNDPTFKKELPLLLASIKNELDYVEIVKKYQIKTEFNRLHKIVMTNADNNVVQAAGEAIYATHGAKGLLLGLSNPKIAKKAIAQYGNIDEPKITEVLVKTYMNKNQALAIREQAMSEMKGWKSEEVLWKQYAANEIPTELKGIAVSILKSTWHSDIRSEINKLEEKSAKNKELNNEKILAMNANHIAGKKIFDLYCLTCHKVGSEGVDFGPGLSQIGSKLTKQSILNAVLNPSEGISFGYEGSNITMKNNDAFQAIITSKTENELMIKYPGQEKISIIKRKDVKSIENTTESLMPKFGLLEAELANLVSYMERLK